MNILRAPRSLAAAFMLLACSAAPGRAQTAAPPRPYGAIFGAGVPDPGVRHVFDVTASAEAGHEDNELGASDVAEQLPLLRGGIYSGVSTTAAYEWRGRRVVFGAKGATNHRYYHDSDEFVGAGQSAGVGMSARLGERMNVFVNQSVSYSPSFLFGVLPDLGTLTPGAVTSVDPFPVPGQSVYVYDTDARATLGVTRRGSIEGVYSFHYSDLGRGADDATASRLRAYSVGGRFRQGVSRNATLRLGYVYHNGEYGIPRESLTTGVHDVDVGVDYRRALSFTRRTSLDFRIGSAIVNPPVDTAGTRQLHYRLLGDLGLTHEMGRTWRASLVYDRSIGFVEGVARPVASDGVSASLTGLFSRRMDFTATAGMSVGDIGLGAERSEFELWRAAARVRTAVTRRLAFYAEYLYSAEELGALFLVPARVPENLHRQSVRVGLTLWAPVLRR